MTRRRVLPLSCVLLSPWLIVMAGCAYSEEPGFVRISGDKYEYRIPSRYIKNPDSILYQGVINSDKNKSTSLLIQINDIDEIETSAEWNLSLLLFADKSYQVDKFLSQTSSKILDYAQEIESKNAEHFFYQYVETLGGLDKYYYLTFDPHAGDAAKISEKDFFVRMHLQQGLRIEGIEPAPAPSCAIYGVIDGMAVQSTIVGRACAVDNLRSLKAIQDELIISWRVPES